MLRWTGVGWSVACSTSRGRHVQRSCPLKEPAAGNENILVHGESNMLSWKRSSLIRLRFDNSPITRFLSSTRAGGRCLDTIELFREVQVLSHEQFDRGSTITLSPALRTQEATSNDLIVARNEGRRSTFPLSAQATVSATENMRHTKFFSTSSRRIKSTTLQL